MRLARAHANLKEPADLANKVSRISGTELPPEHIEALESGQAPVSGRLVEIAVACGVRAEWLLLNEGAMTDGGEESDLDYRNAPLTEEEWKLVEMWRQLDVLHVRPALLIVLEQLVKPMSPDYQAQEGRLREDRKSR